MSINRHPDFGQIGTIPPEQVMRHATYDYTWGFTEQTEEQHQTTLLEKLSRLPRKRRQLATLYLLINFDSNALLRLFLNGREGNLAPEVLVALQEFDIEPQARILAAAMALFGNEYPRNYEARSQFSASGQAEAFFEKNQKQIGEDETLFEKYERLGEPNEFDTKLKAYSDQFGTVEEFKMKLRSLILDTPELAAWLAEERPKLSDNARFSSLLRTLVDGMTHAVSQQELDDWPSPYRKLFLLDWLNQTTISSGLNNFFFMESGSFAPQTVDALREIGLPDMAGIVTKAMSAFPQPYPLDRETRKKLLPHLTNPDWTAQLNTLEQKLERLTQSIYNDLDFGVRLSSPLSDAMIAYAKRENILPR